MDNEKKKDKDKWVEEGKRFRDSTLEYLHDNYLTLLLIGFAIAVFLGIKEGCNA
ncbi:MAG: hypothetical protein WDM90_23095 [Ferruginibacter sp.]